MEFALFARTSGGCEPIFSVINYRTSSGDIHGGGLYIEADDYFERVLEANGVDMESVKEEAKEQMDNDEFEGVESLSEVPDELGELFVTTKDLTPKQHADIQCAAQEGVDSSISKTINAPNDADIENTWDVFMYVYDNGGKGVTYYRDGTRSKQVKTTRKDNKEFSDMDSGEASEEILDQIKTVHDSVTDFLKEESIQNELNVEFDDISDIVEPDRLTNGYTYKRDRPKVLTGFNVETDTGYGTVYININEDEHGNPFEVFVRMGQSGGVYNGFTEAIGKLMSTALRSGVELDELINNLENIKQPKKEWDEGDLVESVPDAIAHTLRKYQNGEIQNPHGAQKQLTDINNETKQNGSEASVKKNGKGDEDSEKSSKELIEAGESPICPDCGTESLYYSEGCKTCESCGWSEC